MCDHPDREAAMIVGDGWHCDPCIAPLVKALNDGGLQTVASCCGHGKRPGKIALRDGRELFILPTFEAARALDCEQAEPHCCCAEKDEQNRMLEDAFAAGEDHAYRQAEFEEAAA